VPSKGKYESERGKQYQETVKRAVERGKKTKEKILNLGNVNAWGWAKGVRQYGWGHRKKSAGEAKIKDSSKRLNN